MHPSQIFGNIRILLLAFASAVVLCACGGEAGSSGWRFDAVTVPEEGETYAGEAVMTYSAIELPELRLVREDGADEEPPEELTAVRDTFNNAMAFERALYDEELYELDQLARARYAAGSQGFGPFRTLGHSLTVMELHQNESLLSVWAEGATGWGGNHPWHAVRTWNYDLNEGRFISWEDLGKNVRSLREAVAKEIKIRLERRGTDSCLPGWEGRVERLEGASFFLGGEGLVVLFDEQTISARAEGIRAFELPYQELERYFSGYAKKLIGYS